MIWGRPARPFEILSIPLQDLSFFYRLGNSKRNLFTPGACFGEHKHRHGRGGPNSRIVRGGHNVAENEALTEADDTADTAVASSSAANFSAVTSSDLPAGAAAVPAHATSALGEPCRVEIRRGEPMSIQGRGLVGAKFMEIVCTREAEEQKGLAGEPWSIEFAAAMSP